MILLCNYSNYYIALNLMIVYCVLNTMVYFVYSCMLSFACLLGVFKSYGSRVLAEVTKEGENESLASSQILAFSMKLWFIAVIPNSKIAICSMYLFLSLKIIGTQDQDLPLSMPNLIKFDLKIRFDPKIRFDS